MIMTPARTLFHDRAEAGRYLAGSLMEYAGRRDALILALPRGGVPVAFEIAKALGVPMDVFVVRKLGVPGHEELAMGAIASGGVRILNEDVLRHLDITAAALDAVTERERSELARREAAYRDGRALPELCDRVVILVDDGLATGSTMRAAVAAVRQQRPARIVIAVPTAARETCEELRREADAIVCGMTPEPFYGVGQWYEDFGQTSDEEVRDLLARAREFLKHDGHAHA